MKNTKPARIYKPAASCTWKKPAPDDMKMHEGESYVPEKSLVVVEEKADTYRAVWLPDGGKIVGDLRYSMIRDVPPGLLYTIDPLRIVRTALTLLLIAGAIATAFRDSDYPVDTMILMLPFFIGLMLTYKVTTVRPEREYIEIGGHPDPEPAT